MEQQERHCNILRCWHFSKDMFCKLIQSSAHRYRMKRIIITGSKFSLRIPRLGEAFFTSAIKPGRPVRRLEALRAPMKSLVGGALSRAFFSEKRGFRSFD